MYQKILLCTDGSAQALSTSRLTADLACRFKAHVDLVNVLDPIIAAGSAVYVPEVTMSAEVTLEYAREGQQVVLQCTGEILDQAHVPYRTFAELGHPVESIQQIATQEKADLIVMGSRGLSSWPALLLGSVSEGVACHAPCPVLIVRGEPQGFHKIVMATDGSEAANRAVRAGMELAREYHADVNVLNVFQRRDIYPGIAKNDLDPEVYAARVKEAIAGQVDPIAREAGVPYRLCQEQGHPAQTLVGFAATQRADLIVVGSRGQGGFKRMLLGSVSANVLHHAHCSILVVR